MYCESLKTTDVEGAIRAQTLHYWVWGWDSLTSNECTMYYGDIDFLEKMLEFFMETSDQYYGISHKYTYNNKGCFLINEPIDATSQGMYITVLDIYRLGGGDFKKYYKFAKVLFEKILSVEFKRTGFVEHRTIKNIAIKSLEWLVFHMGDFILYIPLPQIQELNLLFRVVFLTTE